MWHTPFVWGKVRQNVGKITFCCGKICKYEKNVVSLQKIYYDFFRNDFFRNCGKYGKSV